MYTRIYIIFTYYEIINYQYIYLFFLIIQIS